MQTTTTLPHQPPAVGGWFFDEKVGKPRFLMPPYPGVDDAVKTAQGLAYRRLALRDIEAQIQALTDTLSALLDKAAASDADLDAIEDEAENINIEHRALIEQRRLLKRDGS